MELLKTVRRKWSLYCFHRKIDKALALHSRGEVRRDGLLLHQVQGRLGIQWQARDIHPWDAGLSSERQRVMFIDQTLADVCAVVQRLFEQFPEISSLDLRVLNSRSGAVIVAGVVERSSLAEDRPWSDNMWLRQLGLIFRVIDDRFEAMILEQESTLCT